MTQNRITVGASAEAVRAALAKCQADKLPFVTVALVDRFGTVQALLRGDNAAEHTIEAAKQKAYTAAAFGAPTSELAKRINGNGPSIADLPGTLFLAGGVPLKVNGVSVAGIGVGGAPDGNLDEACATAGAEAIAARPPAQPSRLGSMRRFRTWRPRHAGRSGRRFCYSGGRRGSVPGRVPGGPR